MAVLDFLREHVHGFNVSNFGKFRYEAEQALKGLKVTVTHRQTKQKYIVAKLTDKTTRNLYFPEEGSDHRGPTREIYLVDYFWRKYGKEIRYLDIPCLDLGKGSKKNYVPMEFCVLVEGQRYPKEQLDWEAGRMLKQMSLVSPRDRQMRIHEMVRADDGPCGGEVSKNFGIEVDMNMTKVVGRVIEPPGLKLGDRGGNPIRIQVDPGKCHWNLVNNSVAEGKSIERWAILDFSSFDRNKLIHEKFIPELVERCRKLKIRMEKPLFTQKASMRALSNVRSLRDIFGAVEHEVYNYGVGRLQFLLCVMSRKDNGYKYLKWISETEVGIVTQCCLSNLANRGNDQYLANLALKINAKLGGSNVELFERFPLLDSSHFMFIGADVNHPGSRNTTSPSIAAVVGSINWPAANRYAARVRPQDHRKEKIVNFGEMCLELVHSYARMNQVRPAKIVLFRDGVSESQFDMVLNEELVDIKRAFRTKNYNPSITLIVAQKRHQTRLFPERDLGGGHNGNVPPGTVVDTTIVHPFDFDFYLCSHYGGIGTSKPTHYYVLWDEHGFASDPLEKLIYNLCFTFARCTKPVSLVTPVYYADLAAYRGRLYHEAVMDERSPASRASVSSFSSGASTSISSAGSFEDGLYKLHGDLENVMFFV
ncbi:hypothetical protein CRG98_042593 [Punica granatum]|nr:hypothetical protein CRG98_042593 [Punica granatum]